VLHQRHFNAGLSILGFPCNQFGHQEPGNSVDIKEFVKGYDVGFRIFEKIDVNGKNAHPLWKWLRSKCKGILGTTIIPWNFSKFLLDRDGLPIKRYNPPTEPFAIENDILALLKQKPNGDTPVNKEFDDDIVWKGLALSPSV